jgi:hypothetical protein
MNMDGEDAYFMAPKDNSVVKRFAMVSVERVQDAVRSEDDANPDLKACIDAYIAKVKASNGRVINMTLDTDLPDTIGGDTPTGDDAPDTADIGTVTGVITDIRSAVIGGESVYFFALDGKPVYYSISAGDNNVVVILSKGDTITVTYKTGDGQILTAKSVEAIPAADTAAVSA